MPRSPDLAIFVLTTDDRQNRSHHPLRMRGGNDLAIFVLTTDDNHITPCACARGKGKGPRAITRVSAGADALHAHGSRAMRCAVRFY